MTKTDDYSSPVLCKHCEDAFCERVCPVKAIVHDAKTHRVVIDEKSCVGCKMCALACPFGAITPGGTSTAGVAGIHTATPTYSQTLNPILVWEIGVKTVAVKCDLCAFRPEGPACISACPTGGLKLVDYDDLRKAAAVKAQHNGKEGSGMSIDAALATFKGRE
jgi:hydrogenase-4 component A